MISGLFNVGSPPYEGTENTMDYHGLCDRPIDRVTISL